MPVFKFHSVNVRLLLLLPLTTSCDAFDSKDIYTTILLNTKKKKANQINIFHSSPETAVVLFRSKKTGTIAVGSCNKEGVGQVKCRKVILVAFIALRQGCH